MEIGRELLAAGAVVRAYDPEAMESAAAELPDLTMCKDPYETCEGADVLTIVTEWNEFRALDLDRLGKTLNHKRIVDMRNIYNPDSIRAIGFEYWSIGRP